MNIFYMKFFYTNYANNYTNLFVFISTVNSNVILYFFKKYFLILSWQNSYALQKKVLIGFYCNCDRNLLH